MNQLRFLIFVCLGLSLIGQAALAETVTSEGITVEISVSGDQTSASISGVPIEGANVFAIEGPARLVVDLPGARIKRNQSFKANTGLVKGIRLGTYPDKARVVLDLTSASAPILKNRVVGDKLSIELVAALAAVPTGIPTESPTSAPVVTAPPVATTVATEKPILPAATETSAIQPGVITLPEKVPTLEQTAAPPEATTAVVILPTPTPSASPSVTQTPIATKRPSPTLTPTKTPRPTKTPTATVTVRPTRTPTITPTITPAEHPTLAPSAPPVAPTVESTVSPRPSTVSPVVSSGELAKPLPGGPITVERFEFDYLPEDHSPVLKIGLSQRTEYKLSRSDQKTFRLVVPGSHLAGKFLTLPQFPPGDFVGLASVQAKPLKEDVEILISVDLGARLASFSKENEIWVRALNK